MDRFRIALRATCLLGILLYKAMRNWLAALQATYGLCVWLTGKRHINCFQFRKLTAGQRVLATAISLKATQVTIKETRFSPLFMRECDNVNGDTQIKSLIASDVDDGQSALLFQLPQLVQNCTRYDIRYTKNTITVLNGNASTDQFYPDLLALSCCLRHCRMIAYTDECGHQILLNISTHSCSTRLPCGGNELSLVILIEYLPVKS